MLPAALLSRLRLATVGDHRAGGADVSDYDPTRIAPAERSNILGLDDHHAGDHQDRPHVVRLDRVTPEPVEWLWPGRIPRRKVTLWFGDPGAGKTYAAIALAAAITRGAGLPGGGPQSPATVLLCNAEDGVGDTLRTRLESCGADLTRVLAVSEVFTLDDRGLRFLRETVEQDRPGLVVLDPLMMYAGGKVDLRQPRHVRRVFVASAALAERYRCAVVIVHHTTKGEARKAIHRAAGSLDIVAAVRIAHLFATDPDDAGRGLMIPVKSNIGPLGSSLGYRLTESGFQWNGASTVGVTSVLGSPRAEPALQDAVAFLRRELADGGRPAKDVIAAAEAHAISVPTLRRAREALGIKPEPVHRRGEGERGIDHYTWTLPADGQPATVPGASV